MPPRVPVSLCPTACARPLRVEARSELLELLTVLAHVRAHRREVLLNEINDARIRIHLGIQPSTAASHRGGTEVDEQVLPAAALLRRVKVPFPGDFLVCDGHVVFLR